jgi:hypothetical protein
MAVSDDFVLGMVWESVASVVLGLKGSSSLGVGEVGFFVPCEEAMVVSSSYSKGLVAPGLVSLLDPCGGSIMMSSSRFGTVGGSVFVVFVLGGVLFCGGACFGFGKLVKRTSVSPLLYPVLERADEVEESEEADESVRDRASSFLLPDFDFKMLEDSFFLLGKVVRVAVRGCGCGIDSASQSNRLSRSLRSCSFWLEILSL